MCGVVMVRGIPSGLLIEQRDILIFSIGLLQVSTWYRLETGHSANIAIVWVASIDIMYKRDDIMYKTL